MTPFVELAQMMLKLDDERQLLDHDEAKLEILWDEMIQMCLWYIPFFTESRLILSDE